MMLLPASTEFAALCQSQIATMAQVVGADSTAVYLAENWTEQALPKLIPIAVYPPVADSAQPHADSHIAGRTLPKEASKESEESANPSTKLPPYNLQAQVLNTDAAAAALDKTSLVLSSDQPSQSNQGASQQLAVPLVHEGQVVGILAGWRADRSWQSQERLHMEQCARSLALACVLDQRGQWLQTQLATLNRLQTQQSDRFHELLHQLRNPLTALKTFGKLMFKRLTPEDRNQTLVSNMLRESDRMQELLGYFDETLQAAEEGWTSARFTDPLLLPSDSDDVTGDTTLEAEALPVSPDSLAHFGGALELKNCFIVSAVITPLINSAKTLAEVSGMTFHVFGPDPDSAVEADCKALKEVISILLENAFKYSPTGTTIWLQGDLIHASQTHLRGIAVGDTGSGIPKSDQPHIFERRYRGIQASGDINGSGLGLAIACDLVQEMKGTIEVYSPLAEIPWQLPDELEKASQAKGTAFVVWLPQGN